MADKKKAVKWRQRSLGARRINAAAQSLKNELQKY